MDKRLIKIETGATWDQLALPYEQKSLLLKIAGDVTSQRALSDSPGLGKKLHSERGITILFTGPTGTGKTMASELFANELNVDLYRVDLSQVISKYIGETEKNLAGILDATENNDVILLFDEADALFGKRNEVKDAHDRYANQEVSYLLQRLENFDGLVILTCNLKSAIEDAFVRRFRYVVEFPLARSIELKDSPAFE